MLWKKAKNTSAQQEMEGTTQGEDNSSMIIRRCPECGFESSKFWEGLKHIWRNKPHDMVKVQ